MTDINVNLSMDCEGHTVLTVTTDHHVQFNGSFSDSSGMQGGFVLNQAGGWSFSKTFNLAVKSETLYLSGSFITGETPIWFGVTGEQHAVTASRPTDCVVVTTVPPSTSNLCAPGQVADNATAGCVTSTTIPPPATTLPTISIPTTDALIVLPPDVTTTTTIAVAVATPTIPTTAPAVATTIAHVGALPPTGSAAVELMGITTGLLLVGSVLVIIRRRSVRREQKLLREKGMLCVVGDTIDLGHE